IVLGAIAVGSFVVRLGMQRLINLLGNHRLLAGAFYSGAVAFALVPFMHSAIALTILTFAFGVFWGCSQPIIMRVMFDQAEEGRGGEAIGLRLTVNNLMRIVGPALFGAIGAAISVKAIFWIEGALMTLGGRLSQFPNKESETAGVRQVV